MKKRTTLIQIEGLKSSYNDPNNPTQKLDISKLKSMCWSAQDTFVALQKLFLAVENAGGTLFISDLFRSWAVQEAAYQAWVRRERRAYAAPPGESFHMSGRAVDFDVYNLNFREDKSQWLRTLWDLAIPLGWHPIIAEPRLETSECWHFEFPGEWSAAYAKLPNAMVAKCSILDSGNWNDSHDPNLTLNMFIQAQLIRLGYLNVIPDGYIGPVTSGVLKSLGLDGMTTSAQADALILRKSS